MCSTKNRMRNSERHAVGSSHQIMKKIFFLLSASMIALINHAGEIAGTVKSVKGSVRIERDTQRIEVMVGTKLHAQDRLFSGPASNVSNVSNVSITLRDSTMLTAGANSTIELSKYSFDRHLNQGHMDTLIQKGTLAVVSGQMAKTNPDQVVYRTNTVTLGVRGTEFIVHVEEPSE